MFGHTFVAGGDCRQCLFPIPARNCHQPLRSAPPFDARFTNNIGGAQFTHTTA